MTQKSPRYDDVELAHALAQSAGEILFTMQNNHLLRGQVLGKLGDSLAQNVISSVLASHRPYDAVLSEEAPDLSDRLKADRVWIIDPLDGTSEYSGLKPDWAVHIALWRSDAPLLGAVAIPSWGRTFLSTTIGISTHPATGIAVVSRSRASKQVLEVARKVGLEVKFPGSAGVKIMHVVTGLADAYFHTGGQYQWDSSAPVAIALQAGLHCSRVDGSPLVYNQADTYLPDLIVCRPELAEGILAAFRET